MPEYLFQNKQTGKKWKEWMTISGCDLYLKENPSVERLVYGAPMIHSGRGFQKIDNGFKDLLKEMKKKHSRGLTKSTINVDR